MPKFTSETARLAGQKSKRGKAKLDPTIQDAMETLLVEGLSRLYEKMDELDNSQLLKLVQFSANYVLPKTKPQLDRWSQGFEDDIDYSNKTDFMEDERMRK